MNDDDPTYWSQDGKDILIFSDGTGQIGGLRPDQRLSNVYKLFRAMRPDDNPAISPRRQVAFYDAGLGASEGGGNVFDRLVRISASAFGTGIGENVIDCYEAILRFYERGDRIFLFGFSRGAYTARSLARVLNLCGVPTTDGQGGLLPRHGSRLRKIAEEAVYDIHDHGLGHPRAMFEDEREIKAARFREKYGSQGVGMDGEGQGNVAPHFIGVFDTEDRARFPLVKWGYRRDVERLDHLEPKWLKQMWFAGNHSDIGGSYPESESRLSDIPLAWMVQEIGSIERPPIIDLGRLNLAPDPSGLQHDEVMSLQEVWPSWLPFRDHLTWRRETRTIGRDFDLHESVYERFELPVVSQHDRRAPYRPAALATHDKVSRYYSVDGTDRV